jgi:acyl CoA:acetate/3-ketoacid CoA transferase beta subunit
VSQKSPAGAGLLERSRASRHVIQRAAADRARCRHFVVTNFGPFEITKEGMALREIAPGVTVDEVEATTGCNLIVPAEVTPVRRIG